MALQWGRGSASGACSPVETWGPHSGIFSLNPFSQSCSSTEPLRFWGIFAATQLLRLLRRSLTPSGTTPWATKARYLLGGSAPPPLLPIALCERPVRRAGTLLSHPQCESNSAWSPSPTPPFPFLSPLSLHAQVRSVVPCLSEMEHPCSQALFHEISVCSTQGPCPLTHRCGTDVGSWYLPCHSPASPSCILALIRQGSTWAVQP